MNTSFLSQYNKLYQNFSLLEKIVLAVFLVGLTASTAGMLKTIQNETSTTVPASGGTYKEGIVGFARYSNPVLANTQPDQDITKLVYAGLMTRNNDGEIIPELATNMSVANNQTEFTFQLDPSATFHDGHPLRAEDVVFTIRSIKDPQINSPKRGEWEGVTVSALNDTTVRFTTEEPFAGLPANATVGILPKHLWDQESARSFAFSELNTRPVGAGPFQVTELNRNADGTPTEYNLQRFENYVGQKPYLENITVQFFADNQSRRQAYEAGKIDGMASLNPAYASKLSDQSDDLRITTREFNRVFSVFFNGNNNEALVDKQVRKALAQAVPKSEIVSNGLANYGTAIDSPLPPSLAKMYTTGTSSTQATTSTDPGQTLAAAGWELNDNGNRSKDGEELTIELVSADIPSLRKATNLIAQSWEDTGVTVERQLLPASELTRNIIRPRDYEALLFGQSVSNVRDLYSFWHSSRKDDPGLNFAQYTNSDADDTLEKLRTATSSSAKKQLVTDVLEQIQADQPAAFVFSPSFIYALPNELENVQLPPINQPADRFTNVNTWYADTNKLWNIFVEKDKKK